VGKSARLDASFFERLFDGAGLAVFACDPTGRIRACNPHGQKLFTDRDGCGTGDAVVNVLPEEDRATFAEHLKSCVETREPLEFRTHLSVPGVRATEYAVWLTPILEADGSLEGVTVWFHDITSRLQLRRSLRKRERLNTLGTLSGAVAHHYNNFLCSIATSLEYAMNLNTMSAMRRALRRTADAVARATQLTRQLLAFAQADYRAQDLSDLTETVLYYFDRNEPRLRQRHIRLTLNWEKIPTLSVPREQLLIVLDNLVGNAIEAMPNGGMLTVTLGRHSGNGVCLSIADSGCGLSPEDMEHVFEPFHTSKGELGSGELRKAGMGLAVAHGLVSEMRGTITASNVPGGGAQFDICLPLDAAARSA
jgi:signal transduction histidine kinase